MPESTTPLTPEERLAARLADALDGVLPRMAFLKYGQFYNDDPDFDIEAYYLRVAESLIAEHPSLFTLDAARAASPDGLDVERLARALHEVRIPACQPTLASGGTGMMTEVIWECSAKDHLTAAAALRAALAQPAPEAGGEDGR